MFKGPLIEIFELLFSSSKTDIQVMSVVLSLFSVLVIIFVVFPIHECAHGLMAKMLGDDTAERQGRLTLNPFAHIDPLGALAMLICRIGWAKPTPVDLRRCTKVKARTALALTSLAGPVSNILLGYVLIIIQKVIMLNIPLADYFSGSAAYYVALGIGITIQINIYLAVFNLIPIPPFDGFNILSSFLPYKAVAFMQRYQQVIYLVFFGLLVFGALDKPLGYATDGIMWLLDKASFFIPEPSFI